MADYANILSTVKQVGGVSGVAIADANGQQLLQNEIANAPAELASVANAVFGNIGVQIKRMQRGTIRRLVLETDIGITLLSGLAGGELLIVFVDSVDGFNLSQLLDVVARF